MSLSGGAGDLLRRLAAMPFLDRLELVAISGWSRGTVYEGVRALEDAGLLASIPHATDLLAPTRRFHMTARGLAELAREEGLPTDELLRSLPLSAQWRRRLLQRLDAVAAVYRLAATVAGLAWPARLRWYRAVPADAILTLPRGRTVAVVRQGPTTDRTAFARRLRRLCAGPRPSGVLVLLSDEVRLHHTARVLRDSPAPAFLALEREAVLAEGNDLVWRMPHAEAPLSLEAALDRMTASGGLPTERPLSRIHPPWDLHGPLPGRDLPDDLLPALLKPAEKRVLALLADWPWIEPAHLRSLLGVSRTRLSALLATVEDFGLAARVAAAGGRLALTERGLALPARRDRASVGAARRRWSAAPLDAGGDGDWRSVRGRNARQLLRHLDHTASVHAFLAALASQARAGGWEVVELDPPHRASRFFRHDNVLRSVQPDAFGLLRQDDATWAFFLEWERRAVRPTTMAARLAPYLRYYASDRPVQDHGLPPAVLIVFHDEVAAAHFLRVAGEEMARTGVGVPLQVSHRAAIEELGPLTPDAWVLPGKVGGMVGAQREQAGAGTGGDRHAALLPG